MRARIDIAVLAAAALAGCSSPGAPRTSDPPVRAAPAGRADADPQLLRTLAVLATRRAPSPAELAATQQALTAGQLTMAGYIERLVASEEFAAHVAPLAILRHLLSQDALSAPSRFVLNRTEGDRPIYYLGAKPCKPAKAIRVRPWWDLDHEVSICPEAYRPTQWMAERPKGEAPMDCLSAVAAFQENGGRTCGCGPNLIRCFASRDQNQAAVASLREELRATVEHIVAHDLPAERIFTSNETFRDRTAEFVQRVSRFELEREANPEPALRELASWPAEGKWAPREELGPGQHAGVLTSPMLLFNMPDRRQRMSILYDPLWCVEPDSVGATPEGLIGITNGNLQFDSAGWRQLAAKPLCTNCHARLDYGMQFFWGYPNGNLQAFFVPGTQQSGKGPLYVNDIDDKRGEAELNPRGFAELAVAQPEFRTCMARDVAAYVLGDRMTREQLSAVEAEARPNATSVRALMRRALLALVEDWSTRPAAASPAAPPPPAATGHRVAVTPALTRQLEAHCLECHDRDAARVDLSGTELARATVVAMLADVAFGRMPKNAPLPLTERRKFVDSFVPAVWSGEDADAARAYFAGGMMALPAYRPEVVLDLVHAGGHGAPPWRMLEASVRSDLHQVTPGLVTISSVAAIEACRASEKGKPQAEIDRCIANAIRLANLASNPH
jgi:hypothetical protein